MLKRIPVLVIFLGLCLMAFLYHAFKGTLERLEGKKQLSVPYTVNADGVTELTLPDGSDLAIEGNGRIVIMHKNADITIYEP